MKGYASKNVSAATLPAEAESTKLLEKGDAEKAYERFKLQWMLDHGHTLAELVRGLEQLREESDPDESLESIFADWEYGYGFGSEIWPCFKEFLDCEYKEMEGITH